MTTALDPDVARKLINHLKAGTTPLDAVEHVNVGNEKWYSAAGALFDEIGADSTKDSLVRFISGYYGDGKTHFMGMLRAMAFKRRWVVTYVTAENTPLNKFDIVYAQLVKNLSLPSEIAVAPWLPQVGARGAAGLLAAVFSALCYESSRTLDQSSIQKQRVLEAIRYRADELAAAPELFHAVGAAFRLYVEAIIRGDKAKAHLVASWLEGETISSDDPPLRKRIDQKTSRDASRSLSILAARAGARGVLVLLDEAERIMEQSRQTRVKSYGVLRDLLDNADNQGGMQRSLAYVAATPQMFTDGKGFPEYDALRSRLASASRFSVPGLVDWRSIIVDLTKTPLPHDHLVQLASRVVDIHAAARAWDPRTAFPYTVLANVVAAVEKGPFVVSRPRLLASCVAALLEIIEQNRESTVGDILGTTLDAVHSILIKKPAAKPWE